ncbi:MAG: response regulator [Chloroflexi bacterium]|nr:response regulator [Chloroflexota bacterium]
MPISRGGNAEGDPDGGTPRVVLVVDDEPAIRAVTTRALELFGLTVLSAGDGEEALRIFHDHWGEVGCVLLDLSMPRLDGERTFDRLRELDPAARVVLMTGYPLSEAEGRFGGRGLAGFLQKPFELAELKRVVEAVLPATG